MRDERLREQGRALMAVAAELREILSDDNHPHAEYLADAVGRIETIGRECQLVADDPELELVFRADGSLVA